MWDGAKPVIYAATAPYDAPKKEKQPLQYFAGGLCTSPLITSSFPGEIIFQLLSSFFDWPIWKISGGSLLLQVKDVPAAPAAYDTDLASSLSKHSTIAAGFESK